VIDTIGQNDKTFTDNYRTPHTDKIHVVERWKISADAKTVDVSVYVEDPGAFTTPGEACSAGVASRTRRSCKSPATRTMTIISARDWCRSRKPTSRIFDAGELHALRRFACCLVRIGRLAGTRRERAG
jgi:hypothetical protein